MSTPSDRRPASPAMSINSEFTYIDEDPLSDPEDEGQILAQDSDSEHAAFDSCSGHNARRKEQEFDSEPKKDTETITSAALALAQTVECCSQAELEQWWASCSTSLSDSTAIRGVVTTLSKLTLGTSAVGSDGSWAAMRQQPCHITDSAKGSGEHILRDE